MGVGRGASSTNKPQRPSCCVRYTAVAHTQVPSRTRRPPMIPERFCVELPWRRLRAQTAPAKAVDRGAPALYAAEGARGSLATRRAMTGARRARSPVSSQSRRHRPRPAEGAALAYGARVTPQPRAEPAEGGAEARMRSRPARRAEQSADRGTRKAEARHTHTHTHSGPWPRPVGRRLSLRGARGHIASPKHT